MILQLGCRPSASPLGSFVAASLIALAPTVASAVDDKAIVTDRPTFVASTATVGEHNIQVETGVERLQDGDEVDSYFLRTWATPTLVRLGMPNRYELRVQTQAFTRVRTLAGATNGMADLELGVKGEVPGTVSPNVSLAWMLQAALPTGSQALRNDGVRPSLKLAAAWQLPNQMSVGVMPGLRWDQDASDDRFFTGMLGVNVAHTWNPRLRSYAEMTAREIRQETRGGRNVVWDLGSSWHVQPGTQLDAAVGFGLKENDTDLVWTVGLSRRFTPSVPGRLGLGKTPSDSQTSSDAGK